MKGRLMLAAVGAALLLAGGWGCGGSKNALYIRPFAQTDVRLQAGQRYALKIVLSEMVETKMFVDIENRYSEFVQFSAQSVAIPPGETQAVVEVTGLKPSAQMLEVTFKLRDTSETQVWTVKIEGS
ncbi:MAG: hypothetical protein IT371_24970 [Deltaproteobacteria bacterium]|nr:hypothetical protein [Deltaproteobacteria bacterium]